MLFANLEGLQVESDARARDHEVEKDVNVGNVQSKGSA
jgi:hypothetical protein